MANDISNDPNYAQSRQKLMSSQVAGTLWGVAGAGLAIGGFAMIGKMPLLGVALLSASVIPIYQGWKTNIDTAIRLEELKAQRAFPYMGTEVAKQQSQALAQTKAGETAQNLEKIIESKLQEALKSRSKEGWTESVKDAQTSPDQGAARH